MRAFSLIEVLVALAIVSIALLALLRLHVVNIRVSERTERMSLALLLAKQKMAEIRAEELPELGNRNGSVADDGSAMVYDWETFVTEAPLDELTERQVVVRNVRVRVSWPDGGRKHVELATVMAGQERR